MHLKNLSLLNFKNYYQAEFNFSNKLNCFVGNNGTGKTNLMDAIHYLSLTKSYFNFLDSQNIRYEAQLFMIKGTFEEKGKTSVISCSVQKGKKKKFSRNKKDYKKMSDHVGLFPVVMISPADSALVMEGSEERRKFINSIISQFDRAYLEDLIRYNRALLQRNNLLKSFQIKGHFDPNSLDLWDAQLIPLGERIFQKRKKFIAKLIPGFQKYYDTISSGSEKVSMIYKSQLEQHNFYDLLLSSREKDRVLQYTTIGIHKDDLELLLEGHSIKKAGSQGQQKSYLVALKFSKFDFLKELTGKKAILLLDDIFDKFDALRVQEIIKIIANPEFGQIFITDTHQTRLENILEDMRTDYKVFRINNGISELNER